MRIINLVVSLCVFLCFIISCAENEKEMEAPKFHIEIDDTDLLKKYPLSQFVDSAELIPLETNSDCLIGEISKIKFVNDNIYVCSNNRIYIFDRYGKFKNKIDRIGKAKNEYIELDDFTVLTNEVVLILDGAQKKILFIPSDGEPVESMKIDFYSDAVESINDSLFVFNGSGTEKRVIVWNLKNKKIVDDFFEYDEKYATRVDLPVTKYNNQVYFRQNYSPFIYSVTPDNFEAYYYFDFKKYNINDKDLIPNPDFYNTIYDSKSNANINCFLDSDKYIYLKFSCERLCEYPFYMFYSKETKNKYIITNEYNEDDVTFYFAPPQIAAVTPSGDFVAVLRSSYFLESLRTENNDSDKKQFLKTRFTDMKYSDNPIIGIYHLKQF